MDSSIVTRDKRDIRFAPPFSIVYRVGSIVPALTIQSTNSKRDLLYYIYADVDVTTVVQSDPPGHLGPSLFPRRPS